MPETGSFWSTIPGVLTAVAGLVAAVSGLIAVLHKAGLVGRLPPRAVAPASAGRSASGHAANGNWRATVTYDWGATHEESFHLLVRDAEVVGSASFLGTDRGIEQGRVEGDDVRFVTRTRNVMGEESRDTVHRYHGRLAGDDIRFVMQTEGDFSSHPPVEFAARRVP